VFAALWAEPSAGDWSSDILVSREPRMKRKSTYGLKPTQLARLLHVSATAAESTDMMSEDQTRSDLLGEYLSRRLSNDLPLREALLAASGQSESQVQSLLDRSLQDALLAPDVDKILLRVIKEHGKKLSSKIASGPENLIGITIYHAAIASALVHHGQRITQYSYETLEKHFTSLAGQKWMVCELRALFMQAAKSCEQRAHTEED
jgi:hypothetical protein